MEKIHNGVRYELFGRVWLVKHCEDRDITDLIIPSHIDDHPVYAIDGGAFAGCYNLKSVQLPETVDEIHHHAFANCNQLQTVSSLSGTLIVDSSAFVNCYELHTITTADTITVGPEAFASCTALSNINAKVDVLHNGGFNDCKSLKELHFAKKVYYFFVEGLIKSAVEKLYFEGSIPAVTEDLSQDRLYDIEWHCSKDSNIAELLHLGFTVLVED